jgi:general secretion pathway protein G
MTRTRRLSSGFTLIELMIVISIIAVLTGVVGGNYLTSRLRARDSERKSSMEQIGKALEIYYNDYGKYPGSDDGRITPHEAVGSDQLGNPVNWGQTFIDNNNTVYMKQLPSDVQYPSRQYYYEVDENNLKYRLYGRIENVNDAATDLDDDGTPGDVFDGSPGMGDGTAKLCGVAPDDYCNYGVNSPSTTMTEVW